MNPAAAPPPTALDGNPYTLTAYPPPRPQADRPTPLPVRELAIVAGAAALGLTFGILAKRRGGDKN